MPMYEYGVRGRIKGLASTISQPGPDTKFLGLKPGKKAKARSELTGLINSMGTGIERMDPISRASFRKVLQDALRTMNKRSKK